MIGRRLVTALVVALLISGLFTYFVSRRMGRAHAIAPMRQHFLVASRAIHSGESLGPESLVLTESPSLTPIPGSFVNIADVRGRAVLYSLAKGEPILERYLASSGSGSGLTVKIPLGMRAISLKSDEVTGVSGFLLPGTYVDILVSYRAGNDPDLTTATVLEDVEVIAAGQQIEPDPNGKPALVSVVTLLLRAQDATKAVLASSEGSLRFVLRNGSDREQVTSVPISVSQLARAGRPLKVSSTTARTAAPRTKDYVVETYLGDKRVVTSFN